MRNLERIYKIVIRLDEIWSKHSDLRFWQFIEWLKAKMSAYTTSDLFYLEDDKFFEILEEIVNE